jgi:broad specificity phosphatase PhoE
MTEPESPLARRIADARARSEDLASRTRDFVGEHPVATVAGGIVIGALIAGLLSRRKPIARARAEATSARVSRLATLGSELALAWLARAAAASRDQVDHLGERGADAGHKVADLAEIAMSTLRHASEAAVKRLTSQDKTD